MLTRLTNHEHRKDIWPSDVNVYHEKSRGLCVQSCIMRRVVHSNFDGAPDVEQGRIGGTTSWYRGKNVDLPGSEFRAEDFVSADYVKRDSINI